MKKNVMSMIALLIFLMLTFSPNSFAQEENSPENTVRVIYFFPSDRQPQSDINAKLDTLMKDSQQFYADQMESHGFSRKTFRLETDAIGDVVIHNVKGEFNDMYYQPPDNAWDEIDNRFDTAKNIYIMFLDTSIINKWNPYGSAITLRSNNLIVSKGGIAVVPASGLVSNVGVVVHELGHAFGLKHDYNKDAKIILSVVHQRDNGQFFLCSRMVGCSSLLQH